MWIQLRKDSMEYTVPTIFKEAAKSMAHAQVYLS